MALTYDQITSITQKRYIPRLVDNIFDSDILLKRSKTKGWYNAQNGGTSIIQPLLYAQTTAAGSYAPQAQLDINDNDQFTGAEYNWRFYYGNITISGPDEHKNSGDAAILNLVKNKVMAAEMSMKDIMGTDLYSTGSSATAIGGLRLVVDNASTVGGIAQSTYTWFQSQVDSTTATFSLSALQTMFTNLSINGQTPTVVVATRANYNRFYNVLQPQQRFVSVAEAKAGFQSLLFNGIPYVVGSKVTANYIFMLNENFLSLVYYPGRNFKLDPFIKSTVQDARIAKCWWMGNLTTSNPRMSGKFTAVAA